MAELEKAADNYTEKAENILKYSDGWEEYSDWEYVKKAYINGAKWAIDKACEWLEDNLVQCWIEDFLYVQFKHREHQEKENVLADFRKAMEE